jgi:hypothetical protein
MPLLTASEALSISVSIQSNQSIKSVGLDRYRIGSTTSSRACGSCMRSTSRIAIWSHSCFRLSTFQLKIRPNNNILSTIVEPSPTETSERAADTRRHGEAERHGTCASLRRRLVLLLDRSRAFDPFVCVCVCVCVVLLITVVERDAGCWQYRLAGEVAAFGIVSHRPASSSSFD